MLHHFTQHLHIYDLFYLFYCRYILSSHKKVSWDVSFNNIIISLPWTNADLEPCSMVIALLFVDPKGFFKNGIAFSHWLITECTNKTCN